MGIDKTIAATNIQKAKKLIDQSNKIVIITHVSPDGDAIGSSLALYHFLFRLGKSIKVIVPNNFPAFLKWMNEARNIIISEREERVALQFIRTADLIFCLDFNILRRIKQLAPWVEKSIAKKILIDHHPFPENFCNLVISYPEFSSTSELIFHFICRINMLEYIDKNFAECIYTGMMTDTGAFTYNSNRPQVYHIIKKLLEMGIDKDAIYNKVYNNYSENRIRLQGYILYQKMKILEEYHTSLITLSHKEKQQFLWEKGDTEGFVNIPLSIEKVIFSVFIQEEDNKVRISFRSKGKFPSNQFATEVFNGGGHLNASGGEFSGKLEDAIILIEKTLPKYRYLLNYQNNQNHVGL